MKAFIFVVLVLAFFAFYVAALLADELGQAEWRVAAASASLIAAFGSLLVPA